MLRDTSAAGGCNSPGAYGRFFYIVSAPPPLPGSGEDCVVLSGVEGVYVLEDPVHGSGYGFNHPPVPAAMADVDGQDSSFGEVLAGLAEEPYCGEVKRDVRLAVGVHDDQIVPLFCGAEKIAAVGGVGREARTVHVEAAVIDLRDAAVNLDAVDLIPG